MRTVIAPTTAWVVCAMLGLAGTAGRCEAGFVVGFDDLSHIQTVPNGYNGLNWSNFAALNTTGFTPSGYVNGVVSPTNVAFNGGGAPSEFSSGTPFNFDSAYLTAAWHNGLAVVVQGFLAGNTVYTTNLTLNTAGSTQFTFNYVGVDRVRFSATGGTNPGFAGDGTHIAFDNLAFNGPVPPGIATPAPPTMVAALVGMAGLAFARRVRRAVTG